MTCMIMLTTTVDNQDLQQVQDGSSLHGAMLALLQEDHAASPVVLVPMMLDLSANLLNEGDMNIQGSLIYHAWVINV